MRVILQIELAQDNQEVTFDKDVILLTKKWMTSSQLSQHPLLVLPASRLPRLVTTCPEAVLCCNELSATALSKYRKTADVVEKAPWHMADAARYLREWCFHNEGKVPCKPEELTIYGHRFWQKNEAWHDFAPGTPKRIAVNLRTGPKPTAVSAVPAAVAGVETEGSMLADLVPSASPKRPAAAAVKSGSHPKRLKRPAASAEFANSESAGRDASGDIEPPVPVMRRPAAAKAIAPKAKPQYGCTKCRFKNGCAQCHRFRPGFGK